MKCAEPFYSFYVGSQTKNKAEAWQSWLCLIVVIAVFKEKEETINPLMPTFIYNYIKTKPN